MVAPRIRIVHGLAPGVYCVVFEEDALTLFSRGLSTRDVHLCTCARGLKENTTAHVRTERLLEAMAGVHGVDCIRLHGHFSDGPNRGHCVFVGPLDARHSTSAQREITRMGVTGDTMKVEVVHTDKVYHRSNIPFESTL